ncbi:hypothetical protein LTR16_002425 [Cryomyces antarcticus]|uniref:tRNA(Ile)-lysidine synthetase n=1 Tax=Cryomyces antarcticus TaxID=329879 RepID=A0ABR0M7V2_9PEZI|nr:hypothetical protein LTR16_002425 [Cryomyces antarcticus]
MRGLAVSGGVDSMALVSLTEALCKMSGLPLKNVPAFIIDHAARPGSADEAREVSDELLKHGFSSNVISIQWPEGTEPLTLPDFESEARVLRFKALGHACYASGINSLMLAHHEDDLAETILFRLAKGYTGYGLRGIKRSANIPYCFGQYGMHQSGDPERWLAGANGVSIQENRYSARKKAFTEIESGGVQIYRPLLGFSKSKLIETCRASGMRWFEDKTNKDMTLTPRNAIRHFFQNRSLPKALQKESLLQFRDRLLETIEARTADVDKILDSSFIQLDLRSGKLLVRFPPGEFVRNTLRVRESASDIKEPRYRTAMLLLRLLDMVSPQSELKLARLGNMPDIMLPLISGTATARDRPWSLASVAVVALDQAGDRSGLRSLDEESSVPTPPKMHPEYTYFFSRQTPKRDMIAQITTLLPAPFSDPSTLVQGWSDWTLWDGRFWIRVRSSRPRVLSIGVRFLAVPDLMFIRRDREVAWNKKFTKVLKAAAPARARFTLPVIVEHDPEATPEPGTVHLGTVLAVPTLGIRIDSDIEWEVRYKYVDLGGTGNTKEVVGFSQFGDPDLKGEDAQGRALRDMARSGRSRKSAPRSNNQTSGSP